MCFTVNVNIVKEEFEKQFNVPFIDHENYRPSYYYHAHAFPDLPAFGSFNHETNIRLLKWGLIPGWVRDPGDADEIRSLTLNARAETIDTKPSFAESYRHRRCIIPVRGFFEWQHKGGQKIPWYIYPPDSGIMMLAGLYSSWHTGENNNTLNTFTIVTTRANELMSGIHNSKKRMPVIVRAEDVEAWINEDTERKRLDSILNPFPDEELEAHTISPLINRRDINRNTEKIISPYTYPDQHRLF